MARESPFDRTLVLSQYICPSCRRSFCCTRSTDSRCWTSMERQARNARKARSGRDKDPRAGIVKAAAACKALKLHPELPEPYPIRSFRLSHRAQLHRQILTCVSTVRPSVTTQRDTHERSRKVSFHRGDRARHSVSLSPNEKHV